MNSFSTLLAFSISTGSILPSQIVFYTLYTSTTDPRTAFRSFLGAQHAYYRSTEPSKLASILLPSFFSTHPGLLLLNERVT